MAEFWAFTDSADHQRSDFVFPHVTLRSFIDILSYQGYKAASLPNDMTQTVLWYESCNDGPLCPYDIDPKSILRLRDVTSALEFLQSSSGGYVMVPTEEETLLSEFQPYRQRVLQIIPPSGNKLEIRTNLQRIFFDLLIWENRLNYASIDGNSVEELLDIGASLLCHFMFICELNGNVVSTTPSYPVPYESLQPIEADHMLPSRLRKMLSHTLSTMRDDTDLITIDDEEGFRCIFMPLVLKGGLYGHLCIVVDKKDFTWGLQDEFIRFSTYAEFLCRRKWNRSIETRAPYYSVFIALIDGVKYKAEALSEVMSACSIPKGSDYKLIAVNLKEAVGRGIDNIILGLRLMHDGHMLVFTYDDHLLALSYGSILGAKLSHKRMIEDFDRYVFEPYGIIGASSQVFSNLADMDMAYRQIKLVDLYRDAVTIESKTIGEVPPSVMYFEMVFGYMITSQLDLDRRFMNFCYSHSVPASIAAEDLTTGSNKFALVWFFLVYERNASIVAKRLFMHRNTVLYHVKQIERHYDIDLSNHFIREKMKADFRTYFLCMGEEVYRQLFSISKKAPSERSDD